MHTSDFAHQGLDMTTMINLLLVLFSVLHVDNCIYHLHLGPHFSVARYIIVADYSFLRDENDRFRNLNIRDRQVIAGDFVYLARFDYYVHLGNTADLIIWDRVFAGQMAFYGHGHQVHHDLYTLRGRAVWALENIVGTDLKTIRGNISDEELITNLQRVSTATNCYFNGYRDALLDVQNKSRPE